MAKTATETKSEVVTRSGADISLSDADLRNLTPENLEQYFAAQGIEITDQSAFGSGFTLLKEKDQLVSKPFIIVEWRFSLGDHGEFVSALVMTNSGDKFVINDGSTGIYAQLRSITDETGKTHAHVVRNGLVRSDYEYVDNNGEKHPATTYYLAN